MTIDIQTLIDKKPHLKDPLELYARWQRFQREVVELLPKARTVVSVEDARAYPRENAEAIFQLFVSIFDVPAVELDSLKQALVKGEIDFMRLPLDELPDLAGLAESGEGLSSILFLMSRPYFQALRDTFPLDGNQWQEGRCPLCSARSAIASVTEGPKRLLHCSFCGTSGPYRFIGCPNCGTVDTEKLNTIMSEDEPGFRLATCDACQTYVKIIEHPILTEMAIDLADIASLPLDIIAQEKGYARLAPNPISLKKIE